MKKTKIYKSLTIIGFVFIFFGIIFLPSVAGKNGSILSIVFFGISIILNLSSDYIQNGRITFFDKFLKK